MKIPPVIKINCNGKNIYKHTAPYPEKIVSLIENYCIKNKYVLDPFLGSGSTLMYCKKNNIKSIGYEINKKYYDLCVKRIGAIEK